MKTGKFLLVLLCAALVSAMVLPVNTHAAEYEYYFRGLKISSVTPLAPDYLNSVVSGPVEYVYLDFNPPAPDTRLYVTLSGSAENVKLSVDGRVDITLENLTMTGESKAIDLGGGFNGSLLLKGSNTLISSGQNPALNIYHGAHASIRQATAEPAFLLAKGGPVNPGIRVGRYTNVDGTVIYGMLEIWSGTVTAMSGVEGPGGTGGAGIGGLNGESGGVINIHGGVVTAIGDKSAGIGGGNRSANGGEITINGGTVIAVGGNEGAGIGGGDDDSDGGEITISGGFVTAVGGSLAAGIGGGNNGTSGVITITGGTVIANGGGGGAGIGGGNHNNNEGGNVNSIQIHGGVIFASGKDGGEDIGRGKGATEKIGAVAIHAGQEDSNPPAVFLRNNTLFEWTWIDADGYTNVGPKDYAGISAYGIELSSLYPDTPPAITGTLPAGVDGLGANWLTSLWTNQRNHWSQALQAGAYLQLKATCYFESSQSPGDVFTQSQHKGTAGKVLSLNDTGFSTPAGYTFETWKTSANTTFNPGKDYTFTGGLNLYASWTANTYSVHYDANGGDGGSMADTGHTYDAAAPLRENAFTRAGYSFAGWATAPDGDAVYSDKQSVKNLAESGAVTLYAKWTAIHYTIAYDLAGGAVSPDNPAGYTLEESADITLTNPTKTGYTFAGWTGTGITGAPVMTVTIPKGSTGDRAYTANWTAIVITGLPSSFEMYVGESVTWDPKPEDGTWNWDSGFFSAAFNSPATFAALRPGTSVITYTVNGVAHSVAVTVQQEEPPYTGQRAAWIWALVSLAAVCGAGTVVKRLKKG